jgi:TetR/AcrR family transcriptional repressor of nem operon
MGRSTRAEAARHREQVVQSASRLFRENGVRGANLASVMAEVGLTQGGFYRQFASKDALAAEAAGVAFEELSQIIDAIAQRHPGEHAAAREELAAFYLSASHRDAPGHGCPAAALSADVGREAPDSPVRPVQINGVQGLLDLLGDFADDPGSRQERLMMLSTMVGALVLARGTSGDPVSEEILEAARRSLSAGPCAQTPPPADGGAAPTTA